MKRMWILAAALALAGCSTKFEVRSDTSWTGVIGGHDVSGYGAATYDARSAEKATFTKGTQNGTLSARVKGWRGDGRWIDTSYPYGSVSVLAR